MTIYKVSYTDLRTDDHAKSVLAEGLTFNHVAGIQRGLIVLQSLADDKVINAFSSIAYFHKNHTKPSEIQFFRETDVEWDPKDALARVRRNKSTIEALVDVDLADLSVTTHSETNVMDLRKVSGYERPKEELQHPEDLEKSGYKVYKGVQREVDKPKPKVEKYQLERYLTRFGAFSRSQSKRTKVIKKNGTSTS
jgi:hypothetical protein